MIIFLRNSILVLAILMPLQTQAATWVLPFSGPVVGEVQYTLSEGGETLAEIGRRFDMGSLEMRQANKGLDPDRPVPAGIRIRIPSLLTLPNSPREGIVINVAQFRLYYFPPDENVVITFPVGIGRKGWDTPLGMTSIVSKHINPVWRPTENIQKESAKNGMALPDEFPPGEYNPLGKHALRLGWRSYLLHGTQRPDGVGSKVSAGCIRLFPEDIEHLYELVKVGTRVRVVNQGLPT